jgi:hypothetical protein
MGVGCASPHDGLERSHQSDDEKVQVGPCHRAPDAASASGPGDQRGLWWPRKARRSRREAKPHARRRCHKPALVSTRTQMASLITGPESKRPFGVQSSFRSLSGLDGRPGPALRPAEVHVRSRSPMEWSSLVQPGSWPPKLGRPQPSIETVENLPVRGYPPRAASPGC